MECLILMLTEKVIKHLSELPIESEIIIQWFEKEHVEANAKTSLTDKQWEKIVAIADQRLEALWADISSEIVEIVEQVKK